MSNEKLNPQVVIVTGGSRGIGFGIAKCFAAKGASLIIADVNEPSAQKVATELQTFGAGKSLGLACDITNRSDVEKLMDKVVGEFGRIDVLVNNAGICPFIDIMEMRPETWDKTIDVNLTGAFHCTQLAARHMIHRGKGGRVIFITSLSEHVTGPSQVDYAASKSGLRMTMAGFATALGKYGITSNAVAPGMILTDMTAHHWNQPGPAAEIKVRVPVGRIGTPEDIGHAVVFLASPEAAYISGITIRVDGGHQAVCV